MDEADEMRFLKGDIAKRLPAAPAFRLGRRMAETLRADAGVAAKDIAASMHHASRTTTARYLHTDSKALAAAVARLPDLSYPLSDVATGTDGTPASADNRERQRLRSRRAFYGVWWLQSR